MKRLLLRQRYRALLIFGGLIAWINPIAGRSSPVTAIAPVPETAAQRSARLEWWREARVGLFIHWGLYAIPGRGEWVQWSEQIPNEEYAKLAGEFTGEHFDAVAWAQLALESGMKYAVFTARHHDGFALFDDSGSEFTSVKTAAHRDFVADYTTALRAAGLRVGLYYSPLDWRFPGYILPDLQRKSAEAMRAQYHRQMEQLMTRYGPLDVIWFDGGETDWLNFGADWKGAEWKKRPREQHYAGGFNWQHDEVYAKLRRLQPHALINGRADMPEDFRSREGDGALGGFDADRPWELCTTIVNGAWGWQPDAEVKSLAHLVQMLVKTAGRDGNFLVNVGPRADGTIDSAQARRLREMGAWLRANGESIYATRGGPFLPGTYGVSTHRSNFVYVHLLQWPGPTLTLPALPAKVRKVTRLDGGPVSFVDEKGQLRLSVPSSAWDAIDTIVKLELDGPAQEISNLEVDQK